MYDISVSTADVYPVEKAAELSVLLHSGSGLDNVMDQSLVYGALILVSGGLLLVSRSFVVRWYDEYPFHPCSLSRGASLGMHAVPQTTILGLGFAPFGLIFLVCKITSGD